MNVRIRFILKLPGHEPAVRLRKLDGLVDHPYGALGGGSYDDLRSEEPHELAPLNAESLGHGQHEGESLGCATRRKTDRRSSDCGLEDRLAGLKLYRFFGLP